MQQHQLPGIINKRVEELIRSVGRDLRLARLSDNWTPNIKSKPDGTPICDSDLSAQRRLVEGLCQIMPSDVVIAEEEMDQISDREAVCDFKRAWIVDPIDGTSCYLAGDDRYGLIVTWYCAGEVYGAWIYMPERDHFICLDADSSKMIQKNCGSVKLALRDLDVPTHLLTSTKLDIIGCSNIEIDPPASCCDYLDLISGRAHVAFYADPKVWDLSLIHI